MKKFLYAGVLHHEDASVKQEYFNVQKNSMQHRTPSSYFSCNAGYFDVQKNSLQCRNPSSCFSCNEGNEPSCK